MDEKQKAMIEALIRALEDQYEAEAAYAADLMQMLEEGRK